MSSVGCVDRSPISPSANEIIVHAVLDVSARDQYVVVQSTTGYVGQQDVVTGARVTITAPDGQVLSAEETRDSTRFAVRVGAPRATTVYRISLDRYGVTLLAGGTYRLDIIVPDGREITGSTTIPAETAHTLVPVSQTMDRLHDTLSLAWARVPGARGYELFISSSRTTFSVFADTAIRLLGTTESQNGDVAFVSGLTHQVVASAVDANYYDYFRRASDQITGTGVINHLHGGLGVFGSIVPLSSWTIVVH
jgi:hypothetical protein